jgi:glycolate oxidase FAD binding subunit
LRLSGTNAGVAAAMQKLGGAEMPPIEAQKFWSSLRDHGQDYFVSMDKPLWRLSVPATTPPLELASGAAQVIEWGGALRWLAADVDAQVLREQIQRVGGHATLMRAAGGVASGVRVFHPIGGKLAELNANLKRAFDPANVLNRGRLDNVSP